MNIDLASLRKDYKQSRLDEHEVDKNPLVQFRIWFQEAVDSEIQEPNAMALATADQGRPSLRIVLLKGLDEKGFVFFTNYHSRKGKEMADNPHVALTFFWAELERQVRIEGKVTKISEVESTQYYNSRNRSSRIGAWASPQSEVISSREELERRVSQLEDQFASEEIIPKPDHWGGYRVIPDYIEFWQGRPSRLHDRIAYTLQEESQWSIQRLAP